MTSERPYSPYIERLKQAGLRPTRQRLALAKLLFAGPDRHVTAEQLHDAARSAGVGISLATVYNALHQFTDAGLLREILAAGGRSYFDTNVADHHHFFVEETSQLIDVPRDAVAFGSLPTAPDGMAVTKVEVTIRIKKN